MVQTIHTRLRGFATSMRMVVLFICVLLFADRFAGADVTSISQLQAAAKSGYVPQQIELAAAYFTGNGVTQDAKQAAYWYEKAAKNGDPEAAKEIGFFYQAGIGVPADPARAMHWYQLAAASGLASAKVNLGVMYVWGIGLPKNEVLAAQLFQEAASRGDGAGASYLGDLYYFGMGMEQDKAAAEKWYGTGVKLHDPMAAYNLGTLFSVMADHPHDLRKAVSFLRQSAAAGYVPAMHSLGLLLVNHPELATSQQESLSTLEAAANAGSWKSSVVLGVLARDGKGVPEDSKAAYHHFQVAILQGGDLAMRLVRNDISILSKKLGTQQTEALDENANVWYQHHHLALLFVYKSGDKRERFPASALAVSVNGLHVGQLISTPIS
jgi:TPR repeat protein